MTPTVMPGVADVCSVVSHELRTPLMVLQGYLRLLQAPGAATNPDHVSAMLEATARLAAVGRQASSLSSWVRPEPACDTRSVMVQDIVDAIRDSTASPLQLEIAVLPEQLSRTFAVASDAQMLATAVIGVALALQRHTEADGVRLGLAAPPTRNAITLGAIGGRIAYRPDPAGQPWFRSGGAGLTFISAAVVLEQLQISVEWQPEGFSAMLRLPARPES